MLTFNAFSHAFAVSWPSLLRPPLLAPNSLPPPSRPPLPTLSRRLPSICRRVTLSKYPVAKYPFESRLLGLPPPAASSSPHPSDSPYALSRTALDVESLLAEIAQLREQLAAAQSAYDQVVNLLDVFMGGVEAGAGAQQADQQAGGTCDGAAADSAASGSVTEVGTGAWALRLGLDSVRWRPFDLRRPYVILTHCCMLTLPPTVALLPYTHRTSRCSWRRIPERPGSSSSSSSSPIRSVRFAAISILYLSPYLSP